MEAVAVQPDGKISSVAYFLSYNGVDVSDCIARLNADGTLDTSSIGRRGAGDSIVQADVRAVAVQPDGKILIGEDSKL